MSIMVLGPDLALATAVVALTSTVRGFSGFGGALVLVPGLSVIYGPTMAVAALMLLEIPALGFMLPQTFPHTNWKVVLQLAGAAAILTPAGAYLLVNVDPVLIRRAIGTIVVVFVAVLASGWRYPGKGGTAVTMATGATAGFIGAATGVGGPPVIIYFLSGPFSARQVRANMTGYWAAMFPVVIGIYAWHGLITVDLIVFSLFQTPLYILGAWVGGRMFRRSSEVLFRRIAFLIVAVMGLSALFA